MYKMWKIDQTRLTLLITFTFLAAVSSPGGFAAGIVCQVCSCTEQLGDGYVNCTHRNLSSIPRGFPASSSTFDLRYNQIIVLDSKSFQNLTNLEKLYLEYNNITFISDGCFEGLIGLTKLNLRGNNLTNISIETFRGLKKLKQLYLEDNNIGSIAAGGFQDLRSLTTLQLQGNNLINISSETFRGLKKLRYLYLKDNSIEFVESGGLQDLGSLITLNLERNNISELGNGIFRGLKALTKLYLNDNRIHHVAPETFMDVTTLNSLFLNRNNISEINNRTFEGLQNSIMEISLENNFIKTLAPGTFEIFKKSRLFSFLSISDNKIEILKNKTFNGLKYLRKLFLENNHIRVIEASAFYRMTNIIVMKLNGNLLLNITNGTFYYRKTLGTLILSDNNISSLPDRVFAKLKSLRTLNLSNNPLQYIHSGHLRGLSRLMNLQMEFCGIKDIEPNSFASMKPLDTLNLARNHLTRINASLLSNLRYLNALFLQNNEIRIIEDNTFASNSYIVYLFLHGNKLTKITAGVFDPLWRCVFLTLNNNKITEIEPGALNGLKKVQTIFLQYNRLERVKKEDFSYVWNLEKLYLFDNKISTIERGSFPHRHLAQLLLYKNTDLSSINIMGDSSGIRKPNVTVYMYPGRLPSILVGSNIYANALHKNGFRCECQGSCTCKLCPRGTYSRRDGVSTGCLACPAGGFYQDSVAAVGVTPEGHGCQHCPNGTFIHPNKAPGKASWECKACPEGTNTTTLAGFRACRCLKNHFRLDRFGPCTVCPGHGIDCYNDTLHLSRGFYWSWISNGSYSDNKHFYRLLIANLAIESTSYNNKTMIYVGKVPKAYKCIRHDSCLGGIDSECAEGYAGPLCANCQSGFYKRMIACHKCPSKKLISIQLGVLALLILVIILVILKSGRLSKPGRRTITDIFLAHVKIVIGFYQVLAGLLQAFSYIKWPSEVSTLESYIRFVQLNFLQIVSPSCVEESFKVTAYGHFVFTMAGNVLIIVVPMFCYLVRIACIKSQRKEINEINLIDLKKTCLKIAIFLLFVAYQSTCVNTFKILPFACHELCPFEGASNCPSFLRADYSIPCDTDTHWKFIWAAYASLIYVVGFPIFLAYIVWKIHRQSQSANNLSISDEGHNMKAMAFAIMFLHENYSPSCWYWESIEMARKVILSAAVIFVGSESRTQVGIAAMISTGFAMLHGRFRPITDRFEDYLQMTSLLVTSFNLGIGVLLKVPLDASTGTVNESHDNVGLGILLLVTNALVITVVVVRYLVVFFRLAMDFCSNPRFSWSCLFLLMTTAQDAHGDASGGNLQRAATQTVVTGLDVDTYTAAVAVEQCFEFSLENNTNVSSCEEDGKPYSKHVIKSGK